MVLFSNVPLVDHKYPGSYTRNTTHPFHLRWQALDSTEVAQLVVDLASDKLAGDIVMLDLRHVAPFADYFVIMSAESSRQIEALEEDLTQALKEAQVTPFHREGTASSGWVLLDFSDVIIHIFGSEQRSDGGTWPACRGPCTH